MPKEDPKRPSVYKALREIGEVQEDDNRLSYFQQRLIDAIHREVDQYNGFIDLCFSTCIEKHQACTRFSLKAIKHLALVLPKAHGIKRLDLRGQYIGDAGIKYLSEALLDNPTLVGLYIENNNINQEGFNYLLRLLKLNRILRSLDEGQDLEISLRPIDRVTRSRQNRIQIQDCIQSLQCLEDGFVNILRGNRQLTQWTKGNGINIYNTEDERMIVEIVKRLLTNQRKKVSDLQREDDSTMMVCRIRQSPIQQLKESTGFEAAKWASGAGIIGLTAGTTWPVMIFLAGTGGLFGGCRGFLNHLAKPPVYRPQTAPTDANWVDCEELDLEEQKGPPATVVIQSSLQAVKNPETEFERSIKRLRAATQAFNSMALTYKPADVDPDSQTQLEDNDKNKDKADQEANTGSDSDSSSESEECEEGFKLIKKLSRKHRIR